MRMQSATEAQQGGDLPSHKEWTLSQERTFMEDLVYKRLTAFLSAFVVTFAGWIATLDHPALQAAIAFIGLIVCRPLDEAVQRAQEKLSIILNVLFEDKTHPAGWVNARAQRGGSRVKYVAFVPRAALAALAAGLFYAIARIALQYVQEVCR